MLKAKNKERILQASNRQMACPFQGNPTELIANFSSETMKARGNGTMYSKKKLCLKKTKLSIKNPLSSKAIFQKWRQNKDIHR